jgi:lactaldehyde dehydrogenase/glycolaldehyde dehydrogenase
MTTAGPGAISLDIAGIVDRPILLGGEWTPGDGPSFRVVNPADEEALADVASATLEQTDAVIFAARTAQHSWSRTAPSNRARLLRQMAQVLRDNASVLGEAIMVETGKTDAMSAAEVELSAQFLDYNAEWALRVEGEILPSDTTNEQIQIAREPLGVVVAICPWNWPLTVAMRKTAPALVVGNTVVVKPSEVTPLSTLLALQLIGDQVEVPAGVLSVVTGGGEVGRALVTSTETDMVSFTGHRDTGKQIMADASGTLTRVALELGGKAAAIVMEDADLDVAIPALVFARFMCAGEVCGCAERILVHRAVMDEFVQRYTEAVSSLTVGEPRLNPDLGPLVNASQWAKVDEAVKTAVNQGATVSTGGGRPTGEQFARGFWYAPTVLTDVTPDMSIAVEETFGPVVPVLGFDTFEEALEIANDSRYALAGYLFTTSYRHAMQGARDLVVGELFINRTAGEALHAHHGGHKESGYGGEDGKHGLLKYTQLKVVYHNW